MPERLGRVLMPKVTERKQSEEMMKRLGALPLRHIESVLLVIVLFLIAFGMLMIYSATRNDIPGNPAYYVKKQMVSLVIGLILAGAIMTFDYRRLKVATPFIFGAIVVLLLVVFLTPAQLGSNRWIPLGPVNLQPSEFTKLILILALANFFSDNKSEPDSFKSFIIPVLWTLPCLILVFLQPDLGTTLVLSAILLAMLFLTGCRLRYWLALITTGAAGFVIGFVFHIFKPYQVERLTAFISQSANIKGAGYQLIQSKIAIGSGQIIGKGFAQGTQTNLNFIPFHHTDFIFSVIGEELGLIGALVLLGAFCLLIWRCILVANNARDFYGTIVALGITTMFAFQMIVNIGMTIGIMPITGIPLPFISYGGSNLIVSLISIGLLSNIYMHRFSQL